MNPITIYLTHNVKLLLTNLPYIYFDLYGGNYVFHFQTRAHC